MKVTCPPIEYSSCRTGCSKKCRMGILGVVRNETFVRDIGHRTMAGKRSTLLKPVYDLHLGRSTCMQERPMLTSKHRAQLTKEGFGLGN